jgi:HSP20 family protein
MAEKLDQLMRTLFSSGASYEPAVWKPRCDVYHGPHGWLLKFELAGVRPEDIQLSLAGRQLILRGVRRDWAIEEGGNWYAMEISYNQFERVIELPDDVEHADITSEYRDGMLLVCLKSH